jgi:hypothetical protein
MDSINDQNIEICGNLNNFNSIRDFYQCDQNKTCDIDKKICLDNDSIDSSYDQVEIDSSHGDKYTYAGSSKNIKKLKEKFNSLKNDNFISNQVITDSPYDIGVGIPYISPLSTFINSFIHLLRSMPETFDYDLLKKLRKVYSNDIININLIKLLQSIDPNSDDYCFKGLTKNLIIDFLSSYSNNQTKLNDKDIINIINQIINSINDNTKLNLFDICSFQLSKSIFIKDKNNNCILIPNKTFFYNKNILHLNKNDLDQDKKLNDIINNYLSLHSFSSNESFEIDSDVKKLLSINQNISINQNNSINLCDLVTIENIKNYFLIKFNDSISIPSDLFNSIQIKNKYGNHILSPTSIILYSNQYKEFINLSLRLNDSKQFVWVLYNNENIQLFDFKDSNSIKKLFKLINNFHPLMILYKKESLKENNLKFLNYLNELQFKSILFNIISKNENIFDNIDNNEYLTEKLYKYIFKLYNKSDIEPNISNEPFNYQTIKNIITLYKSLSSSEKKKLLKEYDKNILPFEDPIQDFNQFIQQDIILKDKDMDDKLDSNSDKTKKTLSRTRPSPNSMNNIITLVNSLEKSCSLDRDPNFSKSDLENIDVKFNLQIAKRISVANFKKLKRQEQCKLVINELKKLISSNIDTDKSKIESPLVKDEVKQKDEVKDNILSTFNILNDVYTKLQDNCEKKFNINQLKQIIIDFNLGDIPLKNKSQICSDIKSKIKSKLEDINLIIQNSKNILKSSLKPSFKEEKEIKLDENIIDENKKAIDIIKDDLKKEDQELLKTSELDFEQERINELQKLLEDEEKEIKKKEKDVLKLFPISEVSFVKDEEFDKKIPQVKQDIEKDIKQDIKEIEPIIGKIKIKTLQNKDIDLSTQQLDRLDYIIKNIKTIKQQTRLEYELDSLPYNLAKCTGMSV